jgi:putative ABC transport system substrate-binding protein
MKYKIFIVIFLILIVIILTLQYKKNKTSELTIAIIQGASHITFDQANKNFKTKLKTLFKDKKINFLSYNTQGSGTNAYSLAQQLKTNRKIDLFFTIDTLTTLAFANSITDKPIVFMAVEHPHELGLLNENTSLAGITDSISETVVLELISHLTPNKHTIGLLYKNETSKKIIFEKIKIILKKNGYKYIDMGVLDETELLNCLTNNIQKIDIIFSSTDTLIASALTLISNIAIKYKKPFLVCLKNGAEKGAFASVGMKYEDNGYDCAEIAYKILHDKIEPSKIPLKYGTYDEWYINKETAKKIGITVPEQINKKIIIII